MSTNKLKPTNKNRLRSELKVAQSLLLLVIAAHDSDRQTDDTLHQRANEPINRLGATVPPSALLLVGLLSPLRVGLQTQLERVLLVRRLSTEWGPSDRTATSWGLLPTNKTPAVLRVPARALIGAAIAEAPYKNAHLMPIVTSCACTIDSVNNDQTVARPFFCRAIAQQCL